MIQYVFLIAFFIDAGINLFAVNKENKKLEYISKPLLMPLLAIYFILGTSFLTSINWWIILALSCGCAGDIFLMLKDKFIHGMLAFFLGHIFYIISFFFLITNILAFPLGGLLLFIPVILILILTYPKFRNHLDDLKLPVHGYLVVIFMMHISAVLLLAEFDLFSPCFFLIWIGSILFILSDALIAIDNFNEELEISHIRVIIMLTYILGQYLIAQGIMLAML